MRCYRQKILVLCVVRELLSLILEQLFSVSIKYFEVLKGNQILITLISKRPCITEKDDLFLVITLNSFHVLHRVRFVPKKLVGSALRRRRGRDANAFGAKPLTTRESEGASYAPPTG